MTTAEDVGHGPDSSGQTYLRPDIYQEELESQAGLISAPQQDHSDQSASFDIDRKITNHMPPVARSSQVHSAHVSPVRQPTAGFNLRAQVFAQLLGKRARR